MVARFHMELLLDETFALGGVDYDADFAGVAPLLCVLGGLFLDDLVDLAVVETLLAQLHDPLREFVRVP